MSTVPAATWAVFDHFGEVTSLVAVGDDSSFAGVSPRRTLDAMARRLILKPAQTAIDSGRTVDQLQSLGAGRYRSIAYPIVIPDGSVICGAIAAYVAEGEELPPRPLIGTWQWRVDKDGNNSGPDASQWNQDLFILHELDPAAINNERGPVGEWLTKLVPASERAELKTTMDGCLAAANGEHQFLTFGAVTRLGSANPGRKQLALVGAAVPTTEAEGTLAYGFTREVPAPTEYRTTGFSVVGGRQFASAMMSLLGETSLAGLDCVQSNTFVTSPNWSSLGFESNFSGEFTSLVVEEDRERVENYIDEARRSSEAIDPIHATMITLNGSQRFVLRANAVDADEELSRYVLIAVRGAGS